MRSQFAREVEVTFIRGLVVVVMAACGGTLALGCGDSGDSGDGGGERKNFAEACIADGDCATGLICATQSSLKGRCTRPCSDTSKDCLPTFGALSYCNTALLCALKCESNGACPTGLHCNGDVLPSTCYSN